MIGIRTMVIGSLLGLAACGGDGSSRDSTVARGTTGGDVAPPACYRADRSVLGRERPLTGHASTAPGWIRLENPRADSGVALLIDADGAAMDAAWARRADSIAVSAFNDFVRVMMSVAGSTDRLTGQGVATSDAELVRDSGGRLRDFRREWPVVAGVAPCDSLPARARP